ncbi:MAG: hypothetical protein IPI55_13745 [Flavobacteriales bacterium]|nr:hypothetical protein [Flavobacteriales bacterium]
MLCIGDTLDLFIDPDNSQAQVWSTPSGLLINERPYSPSSIAADMGWYSVSNTIGGNGCWSPSDSVFVSVFPLPDPGLPPNALMRR